MEIIELASLLSEIFNLGMNYSSTTDTDRLNNYDSWALNVKWSFFNFCETKNPLIVQ